jgi:chemotaxis protein MotB
MTAKPDRKGAAAPVAPVIVKKIIADTHGGHHGGAWKVAYADFVTAMMAFFLLMWLLGATTEKQRKALADYFTPTLVEMKQGSAGSNNGMFGGDSLTKPDKYPFSGGQPGARPITIPRDATGTAANEGKDSKERDRKAFEDMKKRIEARLAAKGGLKDQLKNVRFTETREGLRIDLVDEADFAMFAQATDMLTPKARALIAEVAEVAATMPNMLIVRGHTDALPYAAGKRMNNWMLSTARAEATRLALVRSGVQPNRFQRIEGVAEREPYNPKDIYDPRNRRISITLGWSRI